MQRVVRECSEFLGLRCNELREGCNRELLGVQRAAFPHYLYYLWPRPRSGATDSSMASFRFGTFMFKELIIGQEVLAGGAGGEQGAAVDGIPPGWGVGAQLFGDGIKMLFSSMTFCRIVLPTAAHGAWYVLASNPDKKKVLFFSFEPTSSPTAGAVPQEQPSTSAGRQARVRVAPSRDHKMIFTARLVDREKGVQIVGENVYPKGAPPSTTSQAITTSPGGAI